MLRAGQDRFVLKLRAELTARIQIADLGLPAKAGGKRLCHSAVPQLPRQYREHKKLAPSYDIACNITIQVVALT